MPGGFRAFFENFSRWGLEHFRLYYGVYRARVVRTDDPENRGRIQICCPEVGHVISEHPDIWVSPSFPGAGSGHGMFWPPSPGDDVRVAFERGSASRPIIYWGGWYGAPDDQTEVPAELGHRQDNLPTVRGFKTPGGHVLSFSDEPGDESVRLLWKEGEAFIIIDPEGAVRLENPNGAINIAGNGDVQVNDSNGNSFAQDSGGTTIKDANNNEIVMGKNGIIIGDSSSIQLGKNADAPVVRFTEWAAWAGAHTHTIVAQPVVIPATSPPGAPGAGTASGVTGAPLVTPPANIGSSRVKVER